MWWRCERSRCGLLGVQRGRGRGRLAGLLHRFDGARFVFAAGLVYRGRRDHAAAQRPLSRVRDHFHDGRGDDGHGAVHGDVHDEPGRPQPDDDGASA